MMKFKVILLICFVVLQSLLFASASTDVYKEVLKLEPVGYWPADEGSGKVLRDRSGGKNHGRIYSVPWHEGFLDFDCNTYQWVQMPFKKEYGSKSFSMGGWVYSALDRRIPTDRDKNYLFGALLIGQPFKEQSNSKLKWAIWGDRLDTDGAMLRFGLPGDNGLSTVEVVSGQKADAVGSVKEKTGIASGKWQHLFYTYDKTGTGSIYINGKHVCARENVPYKPAETPLVLGGGRWGTFNLGGTISLDGSLRHIVFFDRALDNSEVEALCDLTRPDAEPASVEHKAKEQDITYSVDELTSRVKDENLDEFSRGQAALKLAEKGSQASGALPVLIEILKKIDEDGSHLPKVEEFLRNAAIRALLDIGTKDDRALEMLTETFVKPLFDSLDTSGMYLRKCRVLVKRGSGLEALEVFKKYMASLPPLPRLEGWGSSQRAAQLDEICHYLPLNEEYYNKYLSKGLPFADAHYNAYNQIDTRDGFTYTTVVERVSYAEVLNEFEKELEDRTNDRPDPEGKWSRVKIVKISPSGRRKEAFLEGDWFIFDARDEKMDGWAIVLDNSGYIHLLGGQHNSPNQENYIPGSWERLGISEGESRPQIMYWVSGRPGDIDDFEFAGQKNNPRSVTGWMNYMNFARSREGRLFLYGRGQVWTWAMLHYDESSRRWTQISGSASNMLERAQRENPRWVASLGDTIPYYGPGDGLVSAWQPGAYNFCRAWSGHVRGVSFDLSGRMHLEMPILGVGEDGEMTSGPIYAYSDNFGKTFHAADGRKLELPLTVNPIPSHNADITAGTFKKYFDLWISLIREY